MKAVLKDGPRVGFALVPRPVLHTPGDVLIRVACAAVCRTDVYAADGKIETANPIILGHEFAGTVESVDAPGYAWKPGDRVAVNHFLPC